jgi:hypothetical protein
MQRTLLQQINILADVITYDKTIVDNFNLLLGV